MYQYSDSTNVQTVYLFADSALLVFGLYQFKQPIFVQCTNIQTVYLYSDSASICTVSIFDRTYIRTVPIFRQYTFIQTVPVRTAYIYIYLDSTNIRTVPVFGQFKYLSTDQYSDSVPTIGHYQYLDMSTLTVLIFRQCSLFG